MDRNQQEQIAKLVCVVIGCVVAFYVFMWLLPTAADTFHSALGPDQVLSSRAAGRVPHTRKQLSQRSMFEQTDGNATANPPTRQFARRHQSGGSILP
jgi:hypothetical protein